MKYKTEKDEASGLLRIISLIDIPKWDVVAGCKGGLLEKESNLSHEGACWVSGDAWVLGDAQVSLTSHLITIGPIGSRGAALTMFRTEKGASVATGCFLGTLEEFEAAVCKKPEGDIHRLVYESQISTFKLISKNYHKV